MLGRGGDGVVREVVVPEGGFLAGLGEFGDGAWGGEVGEDRAVGAGADGAEEGVRVGSGEVVVLGREREVWRMSVGGGVDSLDGFCEKDLCVEWISL